MGLYERIKEVASQRGYSINRLEKEMGLPRSSISKYNKNVPSVERLQQIADFLNVPLDQLTDGSAKKNTIFTKSQNDYLDAMIKESIDSVIKSREQYYIDDDACEYAEFLHKNPEYRVLFDSYKKVKPEDIDLVRQLIDKMSE